MLELTNRALNRALLDRQMLVVRAGIPVPEAIERLVGLQAQAPMPPYFGLWSRVAGFRPEMLAKLLEERAVVRIVLMRSTIHLVTAADCLRLRPVMQPAIERSYKSNWAKVLGEADMDALIAAGRALVEEQPLTFLDLGRALQLDWPDHDPQALAQSIRACVALVQVPPRGLWGKSGPAAHTTAEAWLGRPMDENPSVEEVLRRYLAAFGPASIKDMQTWSGLPRLREVIDPMRPALRTFRDEEGVELFDLPEAPLPDEDTPVPIRFIAPFDNLLLSHSRRERLMAQDHRTIIFGRNAVISGTVLVDGFTAALWHIERARGRSTLMIDPLTRLSSEDENDISREGLELVEWAAEKDAHDVRFERMKD